jgi:hypothetical protein
MECSVWICTYAYWTCIFLTGNNPHRISISQHKLAQNTFVFYVHCKAVIRIRLLLNVPGTDLLESICRAYGEG